MKENYNKTDGYRESIQMGLKGLKTVGKNISSESELNREKIEFLKNEIENADCNRSRSGTFNFCRFYL